MKIFISWSGETSKRLGEVFRDWLPGVLQRAKPYFTPSDIEKGNRWSTEIAKELDSSDIGLICVTRTNIHSDWILFEAGALSKKLEKGRVCPILFGISDTDLAGPLKQFQATLFKKDDVRKLIGVINSLLGDEKLSSKTLDTVFDKWWPDLQVQVEEILQEVLNEDKPIRSDRDLLEEVVQLSRVVSKKVAQAPMTVGIKVIKTLLEEFIKSHDEEMKESRGYQETLDSLREIGHGIGKIIAPYAGHSDSLDDLISKFENLEYRITKKEQSKQ